MTDTPPDFNPETAPPTLTIDWDAYLPFFDDDDITDDDKRQMIEALWSIMVSFVDLGFGVHPIQQVCGEGQDDLGFITSDMVSLAHPLPMQLNTQSSSASDDPTRSPT